MGYYLIDHPNPHAPVRGDGNRFWGYPSRTATVRLIVIHTSESAFDLDGTDSGAENVAAYQSRVERPSSYHTIVDRDTTVHLLPYGYTAFGARGHNSHAVHIAVAGVAARWPSLNEAQTDAYLSRLADAVSTVAQAYDIPTVQVTGDAARAGATGICGHGDLDPSRRSDPGTRFPWAKLLDMTDRPASEEDDMTPQQAAQLDRIHTELTREDARGTVARYVSTTNAAVGRMERVHGAGLSGLTGATKVDADAVAAAIADDLGDDLARGVLDALAARLTS